MKQLFKAMKSHFYGNDLTTKLRNIFNQHFISVLVANIAKSCMLFRKYIKACVAQNVVTLGIINIISDGVLRLSSTQHLL